MGFFYPTTKVPLLVASTRPYLSLIAFSILQVKTLPPSLFSPPLPLGHTSSEDEQALFRLLLTYIVIPTVPCLTSWLGFRVQWRVWFSPPMYPANWIHFSPLQHATLPFEWVYTTRGLFYGSPENTFFSPRTTRTPYRILSRRHTLGFVHPRPLGAGRAPFFTATKAQLPQFFFGFWIFSSFSKVFFVF